MFRKPQNNMPEDAAPEGAEPVPPQPVDSLPAKRGLSVLESNKPSVISEGFSMTGDILSGGILHIEGKINGKIKAESINIGPRGRVDGQLDCDTLHIKGVFSGSAVCDELVVADNASVKGRVTYRSVAISRGAMIEGELLCKR